MRRRGDDMDENDYRTRIYARYASTREEGSAAGRLPFWRNLLGHLPDKRARVHELGAGAGGLLDYLRTQGFERLTGVDGSAEQVARARAAGVEVELGEAVASLRARPSQSLDVIIAIDLIEHLTKPEVFELLDECLRTLTPGGRLLVHTVNADSPFFGSVRFGDFTHELAFNRSSISQVLRTVGFREVRCFEDRPLVHGVKSAARAVIWELARTAAVVVLAAETGAFDMGRVLSQNFLTVAVR
jgi:2-polyprenyl-3-methyl-5-hydroxy-6-metoxy-1,4-benzoquinol methylase